MPYFTPCYPVKKYIHLLYMPKNQAQVNKLINKALRATVNKAKQDVTKHAENKRKEVAKKINKKATSVKKRIKKKL